MIQNAHQNNASGFRSQTFFSNYGQNFMEITRQKEINIKCQKNTRKFSLSV